MPTGATTSSSRATPRNIAGYLSDSWKIDRWLLDASVRLEHIRPDSADDQYIAGSVGVPTFDLWDNAVELPNGTYSHGREHNTMPTFSVGANYEFTDHMSAYVRVNDGVFFRQLRRCPLQL